MTNKSHRIAIAAGAAPTVAAGERIASLGGNAVDVAVGAAMTAMVAEVLNCSLGGCAFVMVHIPGRVTELIEGGYATPGRNRAREAPAPVWHRVRYRDPDGEESTGGDTDAADTVDAGPAAVAVPGALAALETLWTRHGRLPWPELVAPARELARESFVPSPDIAARIAAGRDLLSLQEESRACFYPNSPAGSDFPGAHAPSASPQAGQHDNIETRSLRIPYLDDSLDYIAHEGARAFYQGDIAALFARELQATGGYVTRDDLASYEAACRPPVRVFSRGYTLALNPAPAVAGIALGQLIDAIQYGWDRTAEPPVGASVLQLHAQAQAEQNRAWAEINIPALASQAWTKTLTQHASRALQSPNTTHLSVTSEDGSAVAITATMGRGAGVVIPRTGIVCNGVCADLPRRDTDALDVPSGHRLVSNLCPTIAWNNRDPRILALGSPGGARIRSALAQVWAHYALAGMALEDAVIAPRLHVTTGPERPIVHCEPSAKLASLEAAYEVRRHGDIDRYFGGVECAAIDANGQPYAVSDPRSHGVARTFG